MYLFKNYPFSKISHFLILFFVGFVFMALLPQSVIADGPPLDYKLGVKFYAPGTNLSNSAGYAKSAYVADLAFIAREWNNFSATPVNDEIDAAQGQSMDIYVAMDPLCPDRIRVKSPNDSTGNYHCDTGSSQIHFSDTYGGGLTYGQKYASDAATLLTSLVNAGNTPDYLIVGVELNTLLSDSNSVTDYNYFKNTIFPALKNIIKGGNGISPSTKLAVSFAYNTDSSVGGDTALATFMNDFQGQDMIAISFYPLPTSWYTSNILDTSNISTSLFNNIRTTANTAVTPNTNLPIFISETGYIMYPANGAISFPASQTDFINRIRTVSENTTDLEAINYVQLANPVTCPLASSSPFYWYCWLGTLDGDGNPYSPFTQIDPNDALHMWHINDYRVYTQTDNCGVDIRANNTSSALTVTNPATVVLSWSSVYDTDDTLQKSGSWGTGNLSGNGNTEISYTTPGTYSYTLGCTGSNSTNHSSTVVVTVNTTGDKRIFVTSTLYTGNLGGLSGADSKCQTAANNASLGGTWKAWLSDSSTSAAYRLTHTTGNYKLVNNTVVASSWNDLVDGTLSSAINKTELNTTPSGRDTLVITNTTSSGSTGSVGNCSDWSSTSGNTSKGDTGYSDYRWTDNGSLACNTNTNRLYCLEQ